MVTTDDGENEIVARSGYGHLPEMDSREIRELRERCDRLVRERDELQAKIQFLLHNQDWLIEQRNEALTRAREIGGGDA